MDFLDEYSLLIAVATPILLIAAMQAALYISGERGTLLLPGREPFEPVGLPALAMQERKGGCEEAPVPSVERRVAPPAVLPTSPERRKAVVRERDTELA